MQLAKIERWYELNNDCADQLETRLSEFQRGLAARGGSVVSIRRGSAGSSTTVSVLCELPVTGALRRL